ncbi:hypothetical protein [Clostridium ljungdahlii]
MVMKKEDINKAPFNSILEILRSNQFKSELLGIGGYDLTEMGNIIAEL